MKIIIKQPIRFSIKVVKLVFYKVYNYEYIRGNKMKKIITYGTFDLIHYGHIELLRRARALGNHLTVAISNDEFNRMKGKKAYFSYEERRLILESIKYVDKVIEEKSWNQKIKDIIEESIDIFVIGDDWEGKFDYLKDYCEVIYLPRTKNISTTQIKNELVKILK